jgi:hypothetical protein
MQWRFQRQRPEGGKSNEKGAGKKIKGKSKAHTPNQRTGTRPLQEDPEHGFRLLFGQVLVEEDGHDLVGFF